MTELRLTNNDVADDLRSTVRRALEKLCDTAQLVSLADGNDDLSAQAWSLIANELGLAGLLVPETAGGAGASAREAAVVCEELGRSCTPTPFLTSSIAATTALLEAGDTEYLPKLADGSMTATVVFVPPSPEGLLRSVVGYPADIVLAPFGEDLCVANVVDARPVSSLDMTRPLTDLVVTRGDTIATADARHILSRSSAVANAMLASEQLGIADWCLTTTVTYLGERRQFGRIVGGFQALKHRLADLYALIEGARAAAAWAAAALSDLDPDDAEIAIAVAVAQSYCADVAVQAAEEALQLHGGIAMTWEHPMHLRLKRAKADQLLWGTPDRHRTALAELIDIAS